LERVDLRKSEIAIKKLLFEKSQEALGAHVKVLSLRTKIIGLTEKAEESQERMARLQEKSSQQEERLSKLEEELARKDELFKHTKVELTNDVVDAYAAGLRMPWPRLPVCTLGWIFLKSACPRRLLVGRWSMLRSDSSCCNYLAA